MLESLLLYVRKLVAVYWISCSLLSDILLTCITCLACGDWKDKCFVDFAIVDKIGNEVIDYC